MKKIMLIYPPGEVYQRGEDRCQINVNASVANALRACNDLGYIASALKNKNFSVFLKDYPAEKLKITDFFNDFKREKPDAIFISTTNGSIFYDLDFIKEIKKINKETVIILKGAIFYNISQEFINNFDFSKVDFLIGAESEFIAPLLIDAIFNKNEEITSIQGIAYKNNNEWEINKLEAFPDNLDDLPFPDRSLMKNSLYINPDTNRPMATITISKGCPFDCIYCLSPVISGKKIRVRSINSIFREISECFSKYNIKDFFFKSDTFTADKNLVTELCNRIIHSELKGKVNWVANSRANTLDEETIIKMKEAGCSMIAIGYESGSDESLLKMKKNISVEDSIRITALIKKHKIKIFGFFLIGFPWETEKHLNLTKELIFKLDTDFIELSIVTPFFGTELYSSIKEKINNKIFGKDSFKYLISSDNYLSEDYLMNFRKEVVLKYHLRFKYIIKKLFNKNLTFQVFLNYVKYGIRLIKNYL